MQIRWAMKFLRVNAKPTRCEIFLFDLYLFRSFVVRGVRACACVRSDLAGRKECRIAWRNVIPRAKEYREPNCAAWQSAFENICMWFIIHSHSCPFKQSMTSASIHSRTNCLPFGWRRRAANETHTLNRDSWYSSRIALVCRFFLDNS